MSSMRHFRIRGADTTGQPTVPLTPADVDAELVRARGFVQTFRRAIEDRYEADTVAARAWVIRLTVPFGLVAYNVFSAVDSTILPDLGVIPMLMRLCIITPAGLFAMWMCSRMGAMFRETFLGLAMTATMLIPVGFTVTSRGTYAPYTMLIVILVSMFGNIVMRLRVPWAIAFSTVTILAVAVMLWWRADPPAGVRVHLLLAAIVCIAFGLVANIQLERSERRAYLLALRGSLHADQLSADNATFSALSLVDQLTGLGNRRAFDAELKALWHLWETQGQIFSILMIDVDHFKRFNDFYGHLEGDVCLQRIANLLEGASPLASDLVARYGGEEFALLLSGCGKRKGIRVAEALRRKILAAAIPHDNRDDAETVLSVTIGVASAGEGASSAELLAFADHYLYVAKREGRNLVFAGDRTVIRRTA